MLLRNKHIVIYAIFILINIYFLVTKIKNKKISQLRAEVK